MILRNLWPVVLVMLVVTSAAHGHLPPTRSTAQFALAQREAQLWQSLAHESDFTAIQGPLPNCEISQPPQPLATPNPQVSDEAIEVRISLIVGTDGFVHSPLVLESADWAENQVILDAVRAWRYRPARCNGAAVESEADIKFFSRRRFE
jgi:hypothetical protein